MAFNHITFACFCGWEKWGDGVFLICFFFAPTDANTMHIEPYGYDRQPVFIFLSLKVTHLMLIRTVTAYRSISILIN